MRPSCNISPEPLISLSSVDIKCAKNVLFIVRCIRCLTEIDDGKNCGFCRCDIVFPWFSQRNLGGNRAVHGEFGRGNGVVYF